MLGFLWGEKMPLPTAAELTDPNATNTQMKQRLGGLVDYLKTDVPTKEETDNSFKLIEGKIDSSNPATNSRKLHFFTDESGQVVGTIDEQGVLDVIGITVQGEDPNKDVVDQSREYTDNKLKGLQSNVDDLHHFTDDSGNIVSKIDEAGSFHANDFFINGKSLDQKNSGKPLHIFLDNDENVVAQITKDGRLIGVKPYDLGIDALFAKATSDEELTKLGIYHDYVKSLHSEPYNFSVNAYWTNNPDDGFTDEIAPRMPASVLINKNKLFVSFTPYTTTSLSDQSHASMCGRFVDFDLKNKTATVDTNTIVMAGERGVTEHAHRHPSFAKVLNKQTGKYRYICLFNRGTLRYNNSELNIIYSDDDCQTWSSIQTLMTEAQPEPFYLIPCTLVEIPHGIFKGRLVTGVFRQSQNGSTSEIGILYSDDRGATWNIGGKLQSGAFSEYGNFGFLNETMVACDNQGNLILGIRNEKADTLDQRVMLWARSYDGGNTLVIEDEPHLVTAMSEGSLLQTAHHLHEGIPKILYSYPSKPTLGAAGYTRLENRVAISYDNGKTFPITYVPRSIADYTGYTHLLSITDQDFVMAEEQHGYITLTFFNMAHVFKTGEINNG